MSGQGVQLLANVEGGTDAISDVVAIEAIGRSLKVAQGALGYGDGPTEAPKRTITVCSPSRVNIAFGDLADKVVKNNPGILHAVTIGYTNMAGTAMQLTIYDNSAGAGSIILVIDPTVRGNYIVDLDCAIGITAKLSGTGASGAADVTFSYQ